MHALRCPSSSPRALTAIAGGFRVTDPLVPSSVADAGPTPSALPPFFGQHQLALASRGEHSGAAPFPGPRCIRIGEEDIKQAPLSLPSLFPTSGPATSNFCSQELAYPGSSKPKVPWSSLTLADIQILEQDNAICKLMDMEYFGQAAHAAPAFPDMHQMPAQPVVPTYGTDALEQPETGGIKQGEGRLYSEGNAGNLLPWLHQHQDLQELSLCASGQHIKEEEFGCSAGGS